MPMSKSQKLKPQEPKCRKKQVVKAKSQNTKNAKAKNLQKKVFGLSSNFFFFSFFFPFFFSFCACLLMSLIDNKTITVMLQLTAHGQHGVVGAPVQAPAGEASRHATVTVQIPSPSTAALTVLVPTQKITRVTATLVQVNRACARS